MAPSFCFYFVYNKSMVKIACKQCGKEFASFPSQKRTCCSLNCLANSKKTLKVSQETKDKISKGNKASWIGRTTRTIKICVTCGKEYDVPGFMIETSKYCSRDCKDRNRDQARCISKSLIGHPVSEETKKKISESLRIV
jgi:hypothetical protein